jgi:hypothetical protein
MSERTDEAAKPGESDKAAEKRLKQAEKFLDTRILDPWERYRALSDVLDAYVDMVELADRKTRFALIILGALNAAILFLVGRRDLLAAKVPSWFVMCAVLHIGVSLFCFVQAIWALKPRTSSLVRKVPETAAGADGVLGLRFMATMTQAPADEYYRRWSQVQIGQLNRELAYHAQALAHVNAAKFRALGRLYMALLVLTFLTVAVVTGFVLVNFWPS